MISAVNGDAVIEDSYVADTVLDVESESGDALIEFSEVSDSDVVVALPKEIQLLLTLVLIILLLMLSRNLAMR